MINHVFQGVSYDYYTVDEAAAAGIESRTDWRSANVGDWVVTDDHMVVPVIACGPAASINYRWIRIPTGTFLGNPGCKLTTDLRQNRFSFTGGRTNYANPDRRLTKMELAVIALYVHNLDPIKSYAAVADKDPKNPKVMRQARRMFNRANVQRAIEMELRRILSDHGITEDAVIQGMEELRKTSTNDNVRLKVLENFAKMLEMLDKKGGDSAQMIVGIRATEIYELERDKRLALGGQSEPYTVIDCDAGTGEIGSLPSGVEARDVSGYVKIREADAPEVDH